jgi:hypothetical protein
VGDLHGILVLLVGASRSQIAPYVVNGLCNPPRACRARVKCSHKPLRSRLLRLGVERNNQRVCCFSCWTGGQLHAGGKTWLGF